jgi:hypothetical protein
LLHPFLAENGGDFDHGFDIILGIEEGKAPREYGKQNDSC